jgi:L-fucose mutarotase
MLKGIPSILSPELLQVLMTMGHSDEICLGDGNFPHASMSGNGRVLRCDGHNIPDLLKAILKLMPLDPYVDSPVMLMQVTPGDPVKTPIWDEYKEIVAQFDPRAAANIINIERFAFLTGPKQHSQLLRPVRKPSMLISS